MSMDTIKKLFHVSREDSERLRQSSFHLRRSQSDIVREALALWFAKHPQATPPAYPAKDGAGSSKAMPSRSRG